MRSLSLRDTRSIGATCGFLAVLAVSLVVAASASADVVAPASGQPGSSPSNPITAIGAPSTAQSYVDILWSDGAQETVTVDGRPSAASAERAVRQRAAAEHRTLPATHGGGGGVTPYATDANGASYCAWSLDLYKASTSAVASDASAVCTPDVTDVHGTLYLYRSSSYTLIGSDTEAGSNAAVGWSTNGGCLSSTWQYNADLAYGFTGMNGSLFQEHWIGPDWITC